MPAISSFAPHIAIAIRLGSCFPHGQANVHHGGNDRGRPLPGRGVPHYFIPWLQPLEDYQKIHITKKNDHKCDLGYKLKVEVQLFSEMQGVESLDDYPESHMDYRNNNRYLHFQAVNIHQLIFGSGPHWIQPKRVDAVRSGMQMAICLIGVDLLWIVAGAEKVITKTNQVIVNPPAIESEKAH